jgi:hypothetical protein
MEDTLTNHHVDDLPLTAELALEQFRVNFPLTNINVQDTYMNYPLQRGGEAWLEKAEKTIKTFNLPLEAALYKGRLFCTLTITYKK